MEGGVNGRGLPERACESLRAIRDKGGRRGFSIRTPGNAFDNNPVYGRLDRLEEKNLTMRQTTLKEQIRSPGEIRNRIQVKNPVTDRYVKIDTTTGRIIDHKKTKGPYKGIRRK